MRDAVSKAPAKRYGPKIIGETCFYNVHGVVATGIPRVDEKDIYFMGSYAWGIQKD